ncbi:MAG: hypothetical protein V3R77_00555 [Candidatus Binatia bacterium]
MAEQVQIDDDHPEIRNFTGAHERAESFIRAKCGLVTTDGLSLHIKHTRAKGRDFDGYYRLEDRRIVIAVKKRLRYPRLAAYGVGSVPTKSPNALRPFKLVWHEGTFGSPDDILVFAAGHELWHFLCHTGQRTRDHETKANCHGFLWLEEFRCWSGPGAPVASVPTLPPRPDRDDEPSRESASRTWLQIDLFG